MDVDVTRPLEKHLEQIRNHPIPKNRRQLRKFLGTANWVRQYIQDFARIVAPLTTLTATTKPFRWSPEAARAMDQLHDAIATPLCLHRPLPYLPYTVQTDASHGIAAVLYQTDTDGDKRIISFDSAKLNVTQQRYHVNE